MASNKTPTEAPHRTRPLFSIFEARIQTGFFCRDRAFFLKAAVPLYPKQAHGGLQSHIGVFFVFLSITRHRVSAQPEIAPRGWGVSGRGMLGNEKLFRQQALRGGAVSFPSPAWTLPNTAHTFSALAPNPFFFSSWFPLPLPGGPAVIHRDFYKPLCLAAGGPIKLPGFFCGIFSDSFAAEGVCKIAHPGFFHGDSAFFWRGGFTFSPSLRSWPI